MVATPAFLIPGTLCDERLFAPMAAGLGLDASMAPPIAHDTVGAAAAAVLPLMPARSVLIGFSLGGFVALELLRRAPERIAGLVLIASNAQPIDPHASRRGGPALARARGFEALIDALWPAYVARGRQADAGLRALLVAMAETVGIERFAAQAELALSRPDSEAMLRDAHVPALLVTGDSDCMTSRERYARTAEHIDWIELDGVGHFPPLEAPDRCAAAIEGWLNRVAACC